MKRRLLLAALFWSPAAGAAEMRPDVIKPGQHVRGRFTLERRLEGFARPLLSRGAFLLVPGRGLIWHSETPFDTVLALGAGGIVQLQDGREAMRLPASRAPMIGQLYEVLSAALAGDADRLSLVFAATWQSGADRWQLGLTSPSGKDLAMAQIASIEVFGGRLAERVLVRRQNGDSDLLTFAEQSVGPAAPTADEEALLRQIGP